MKDLSMSFKLTLNEQPLPDDIGVPGGVRIGHQLIVSNQGVAKYRPAETPDPVCITLVQPLGHDRKIMKIFAMKAGFKLKLTLSLPVDDGNGGVNQKDVLDINLSDLVPDELHVGEVLSITCRTLTPPEFKNPEAPPQRRRRLAAVGSK